MADRPDLVAAYRAAASAFAAARAARAELGYRAGSDDKKVTADAELLRAARALMEAAEALEAAGQ